MSYTSSPYAPKARFEAAKLVVKGGLKPFGTSNDFFSTDGKPDSQLKALDDAQEIVESMAEILEHVIFYGPRINGQEGHFLVTIDSRHGEEKVFIPHKK